MAETTGPVIFAYDGSELAGFAITHAATQLATPRDAVVVCVWQPADVGFTPIGGQHFDADKADDVRAAAEQTAAHGAELARRSGFTARGLAIEASPIWKGILQAAQQEDASLIVLGAHRHGTLSAHLLGHVSASIVSRCSAAVLVIHQPE